MSALPRAMTPHSMVVERHIGSDATGHLYGPGTTARCYVEDKARSVRAPDGRTVVASSRIITPLDRTIVAESRITTFGRTVEVIAVAHYHFPGTPNHTEVMVQ